MTVPETRNGSIVRSLAIVLVVIAASAKEWWLVAAKKQPARVNEAPYVETRLDVASA